MKSSKILLRMSKDEIARYGKEAVDYGYPDRTKYLRACIDIGRKYHINKQLTEQVHDPISAIAGRII